MEQRIYRGRDNNKEWHFGWFVPNAIYNNYGSFDPIEIGTVSQSTGKTDYINNEIFGKDIIKVKDFLERGDGHNDDVLGYVFYSKFTGKYLFEYMGFEYSPEYMELGQLDEWGHSVVGNLIDDSDLIEWDIKGE